MKKLYVIFLLITNILYSQEYDFLQFKTRLKNVDRWEYVISSGCITVSDKNIIIFDEELEIISKHYIITNTKDERNFGFMYSCINSNLEWLTIFLTSDKTLVYYNGEKYYEFNLEKE